MDVAKAVSEVKAGKIDFKVDKYGIVHASIGKVSFSAEKIKENAEELMRTLMRLKPTSAKGTYEEHIYVFHYEHGHTGGIQVSRLTQRR